jgi:hypothetical protein
MNTRDQHISAIREACIKANPELWKKGDIVYRKIEKHGASVESDIRLADVLLAIKQKDVDLEKKIEDVSGRGGAKATYLYSTLMRFAHMDASNAEFWNLRQDDLTQQSDECIAFLADLLQ